MRGRRDFLTLGIAGLWLATACGCDVVSTAPKVAQTTAEPPSRGALPPTEQATVDLFEEVRPSVAYITTLTQRRNLFTGVATEIPRGTGSGFLWDEAGHVVTNLHVLQGATAAQCQGRSKIGPPWRRKTRPLGSWVEWRNAAVRRGRQDAGVAAGWRAFLLCSRR